MLLWVVLSTAAIFSPSFSQPTRTDGVEENDYNLPLYRERSDLGEPSQRQLDAIGGGHLLRDLVPIASWYPRQTRARQTLDALSGVSFGTNKRLDALSGVGFGGQKRNFDEIDRSGFNSFVKKNFDEIDRSAFNSFVKKNFDEIDRSGFNSFLKRNPDYLGSTHH